MIDEKELIKQIESLRVTITGLRARQSVLNEYAQHFKDSVIKIIDEQQKVGEWIPVKDRLPDKEGDCYGINIVTLESGEVCIGVYRNDDKLWYTRLFEGETLYNNKRNVIAWGPLPEPFKGD